MLKYNRTYAEDWISQRIERISQRTGNELPLVNAPNQRYECLFGIPRVAFTLNALTSDNEQNA